MQKITLTCLIVLLPVWVYGQPDSLLSRFDAQLTAFPQEKIYLHIDKPYYISGENIWFRAYLVDAGAHMPVSASRYIYVELINPLDSVVSRVKIRSEDDAYYGHINIPNDVPEGDYTIRAYTHFMQNLDEHYLFTRPVRIGDPQARLLQVDTNFRFDTDGKIMAELKFSHVSLHSPLVPQTIKIVAGSTRLMNVKCENDGVANVDFKLSSLSGKRIMLLETVYRNYRYRQYIPIPVSDNDFDVSFYPEGGHLLQGTPCKVAFKAMKSNGQSINIEGTLFDQGGMEVRTIQSTHLGMGTFRLLPVKGKTYYAICKYNGQSKRFDLPPALQDGYSLAVNPVKDRVFISVQRPAGVLQQDTLYLLAHTRGIVKYIGIWDHSKESVLFAKDVFPSGVAQILLLDARMRPVSERLVFVNNNDQAQVTYQPDKTNYESRSLVRNQVTLTGFDQQPLTGSFSVSVTDDRDVTPDTISSILTNLLLTSELRGYIENPAFYFQGNAKAGIELDLLMLTQGWRRYDISRLTQGRMAYPGIYLEVGPEISGTVKRLVRGIPVEGIEVAILSINGGYFETTTTDKDGRFFFQNCEFPDSTHFFVRVVPRVGLKSMDLSVDSVTYPPRTLPAAIAGEVDKGMFAKYADKAEQKYTFENGIRTVHLTEVVITAQRKPPHKSMYYSSADYTVTEEQLEKRSITNIYDFIRQIQGVEILTIDGKKCIFFRGESQSFTGRAKKQPLLLIDNMPTDITVLENINMQDIAQIDVIHNATSLTRLGAIGGNGVIAVYTKTNKERPVIKPFHIKALLPLGYQLPLEFYAPKYDTSEKRKSSIPDLRTTIYWQPNIEVDSDGQASFEFYTADVESTYTTIIEGVMEDGKIIRHIGKISIK